MDAEDVTNNAATTKATTKAAAKSGAKTTPPKGRPTRSIHDPQPRRVFGSTAQWLAFFAALGVALIILWIVLDDNARVLNGAPDEPVQPAAAVVGAA